MSGWHDYSVITLVCVNGQSDMFRLICTDNQLIPVEGSKDEYYGHNSL